MLGQSGMFQLYIAFSTTYFVRATPVCTLSKLQVNDLECSKDGMSESEEEDCQI